LKEHRLEVADQDALALIEHYDTTGSGEVPIESLMHDLLVTYKREFLPIHTKIGQL